jgi:PilZ domain
MYPAVIARSPSTVAGEPQRGWRKVAHPGSHCDATHPVMTDLRRFPRVPLGQPIEYSTKGEDLPVRMEGTARDISLGGMFVETDMPCAVGEHLVVYLRLPKAKREMNLPAVVRWSGKEGMGVQFGLLGAHEITEFVGRHDSAG